MARDYEGRFKFRSGCDWRLFSSRRLGGSFWSGAGRSPSARLLRRRHLVSIFKDRGELIPFHFVVDTNADPSLFAHVGRNEDRF